MNPKVEAIKKLFDNILFKDVNVDYEILGYDELDGVEKVYITVSVDLERYSSTFIDGNSNYNRIISSFPDQFSTVASYLGLSYESMVLHYDAPESDVLYNVFKRINEDFKSELSSNGVSEQSFIDSELEIVLYTNEESLDWDDYYFEGKILVQGSRPFEEDEELNPEGTYKITSNQVMQIAKNVIKRYDKFVNLLEVVEWIDE
jgi:hypothetical protein